MLHRVLRAALPCAASILLIACSDPDDNAQSMDVQGGQDAATDATNGDSDAATTQRDATQSDAAESDAPNDAARDEDSAMADAATDGGATCGASTCGTNAHCESASCVCDSGFSDDGWPGLRCVENAKVVWTQDFENGLGEWSSEGGIWTAGAPTFAQGPAAHGGANVAGTVLDAVYPNNATARLVSPTIEVPAKELMPRLRYWSWHQLRSTVNDRARAEIRIFNETQQQWGAWDDIVLLEGEGSGWTQHIIQLLPYAGSRVQIGFRLTSVSNINVPTRAGYYVDDLSLETGAMNSASPEGFEAGFADWSSEGGIWAVGTPSYAEAPMPFAGAGVAGTRLRGPYPDGYTSSFISPVIVVPPGDRMPEARYSSFHALRSNNDRVHVKIRARNAALTGWSSWQSIETLSGESAGWTPRTLPLSSYAGSHIQIAFDLTAVGSINTPTRAGFYLDDFTLRAN